MNAEKAISMGFLGLVIALAPAVACNGAEPQQRRERLKEALDNKEVQVLLSGVGASSGVLLVMAIRSAISQSLQIDVPSGTLLKSNDANPQNMAIDEVKGRYDGPSPKDVLNACEDAANQLEKIQQLKDAVSRQYWNDANDIVLSPYSLRVYAVSAYCVDFEKDNPSTKTTFSVSPQQNQALNRLFSYLAEHHDDYSVGSVQLATWAVSDNLSADTIRDKFPFDEPGREEACRLLKRSDIDSDTMTLCTQ